MNASWANKATNLSPTLFKTAIFSPIALEIHLLSPRGEPRKVACAGSTIRATGSEVKIVPNVMWSRVIISHLEGLRVRPMSSAYFTAARSYKV